MLELLMNSTPPPPPQIGFGEYVLKQASATQNRSWRVPKDVTSICVVCVGHGGMAGGGLSWRNNIPVTPGETLTLDFTVSSTDVYSGGSSRLLRGSTVLCIAYAGGWDPSAIAYLRYGFGGKRASSINDGGGDGGFGRNIAKIKGNAGGGAGGYLGKGGDAQSDLTTNTAGVAGSGSGSGSRSTTATWRKGGDVGLYGIGITGASATTGGQYDGKDGSPAEVMCGGGVGYHDRLFNGGIRIIWGDDYSYPYNAVAK